ncbi:GNAT family N-acetyltransferase [Amycolatopsis dendrobii]|uniref:GNAT family N-acetyltransferase n=1 Tax=Amycolatopsis dendrobii TaxID=2760662 RepID=A0A7W3W1H7_9PSEU|nr:GNAT family N-acetyltransferase [Amycolatopsis dendrobii]MBB1157100.1 GNAT family N-acetyltransferase [Amycolatopsis dendrobii]
MELASAVLGRAEIFEREPLDHVVARLSWRDGRLDAARAAVTAAVAAAPAGGSVYLPVSASVSADHAERRDVAQACGFALFQEKEGFWWADTGQAIPDPVGLRLEPMSRIGREPFAHVIAQCVAQTLDRTDALVFGRRQPEQWVATFLDHHASGADAQSWLYAETPAGVPVGFVGLAQRESDPAVGTIVLIGVLPEQRGRRHVDRLLLAAYRAARTRGFAEVQSLVDVANHPMTAAMLRSGADSDADPWHNWLYLISAPAAESS